MKREKLVPTRVILFGIAGVCVASVLAGGAADRADARAAQSPGGRTVWQAETDYWRSRPIHSTSQVVFMADLLPYPVSSNDRTHMVQVLTYSRRWQRSRQVTCGDKDFANVLVSSIRRSAGSGHFGISGGKHHRATGRIVIDSVLEIARTASGPVLCTEFEGRWTGFSGPPSFVNTTSWWEGSVLRSDSILFQGFGPS